MVSTEIRDRRRTLRYWHLIVREMVQMKNRVLPPIPKARDKPRPPPLADIKTMERRVMDSVAVLRLGLLPILTFGVIAMALAMSGVYGLVAYTVGQ